VAILGGLDDKVKVRLDLSPSLTLPSGKPTLILLAISHISITKIAPDNNPELQ
jgi:hypothetical protein